MKKINAYTGTIKYNDNLRDPRLIVNFRRNPEKYDNWQEIHIKLDIDVVKYISRVLKDYTISWWNKKVDDFDSVKKHLRIH